MTIKSDEFIAGYLRGRGKVYDGTSETQSRIKSGKYFQVKTKTPDEERFAETVLKEITGNEPITISPVVTVHWESSVEQVTEFIARHANETQEFVNGLIDSGQLTLTVINENNTHRLRELYTLSTRNLSEKTVNNIKETLNQFNNYHCSENSIKVWNDAAYKLFGNIDTIRNQYILSFLEQNIRNENLSYKHNPNKFSEVFGKYYEYFNPKTKYTPEDFPPVHSKRL